jgi:hypothetical protein
MQQIQYRNYQDSVKQIHSFAVKVLRRLHGLGAKTHSLDDVKQELAIAWCKACEAYRPEGGASFETFLTNGMRLHINRYIEKNFERFHDETIALSLEGGSRSDESGGANISGSLSEVVADTAPLQNVEVENENCFAYALTRLSPRAAQFVTILKDQPKELIEEVRRLEDKSEYARERGITYATAHRLTTPMIFDFMGASRNERKQIMDEVQQIGALIQNQVAA